MRPPAHETLRRIHCPQLDAILGHEYPVLNDGFIRVIDYMGDDYSITQAARISYGVGTKSGKDNRGLIRRLMRDRHTSPFEMCELKLHVRVPIDSWRQWIRHRTANVNEYSTRYSEAIDSMMVTIPGEWRLQSTDNKQGSQGLLEKWPEGYSVSNDHGVFYVYCDGARVAEFDHRPTPGEYLSGVQTALQVEARDRYLERLQFGIAREQARADLLLSNYTEAYWKIDLHNLLHFAALRLPPDAQQEIRLYTETIAKLVALWVPITWEAFVCFRRDAMSLSATEIGLIQLLMKNDREAAGWFGEKAGVMRVHGDMWKPIGHEGKSVQAKLLSLGFTLPWVA